MKRTQIKKEVNAAKTKMADASRAMIVAELELKLARERCPHTDKETWTNDDGDGQFTVERCRICGLQRDGGLKG